MTGQANILVLALVALTGLGLVLLFRLRAVRAASGGSSSPRSLRVINEELRSRYELQGLGTAGDLGGFGEKEDEWIDPAGVDSETVGRASLAMRLRYARLERIPPYVIGLVQVAISFAAFAIARVYFKEVLQVVSLLTGPFIVNWYIERRINGRVKMFDADFPQFLLSVVGMLKTGLNAIQALEAAAKNLDEDSLVRHEVELMLERFRVGVPEERSIGSFAEDVRQPEIELFVQALILSRRVGGNLSETIDRLAKQVRKRHAFKLAASSTVSMQRGSVWVIIGIITALQLYLLKMSPDMVLGAWTHPKLSGYAQISVVLILGGVLWIRKITDFKI